MTDDIDHDDETLAPTLVLASELAETYKPMDGIKGALIAKDGSEPVRVLGETLDPVHFQGRTWCVTEFSLEMRSGQYVIRKDRLQDGLPKRSLIGHIGEKGVSDVEDFAACYFYAIARFGFKLTAKDVAKLDHDLWVGRGHEKATRERRERRERRK